MVFILDEGAVFQVPIQEIWSYFGALEKHQHPSMKNMRAELAGEGVLFLSWENDMTDSSGNNKAKLTMYPPSGFVIEFLEGPFAGTKEFEYYIPRGNQTGITAVGEWMSPNLNDSQLKKAATDFLNTVFREDEENFSRMKR
jgi:hypothetical protein